MCAQGVVTAIQHSQSTREYDEAKKLCNYLWVNPGICVFGFSVIVNYNDKLGSENNLICFTEATIDVFVMFSCCN